MKNNSASLRTIIVGLSVIALIACDFTYDNDVEKQDAGDQSKQNTNKKVATDTGSATPFDSQKTDTEEESATTNETLPPNTDTGAAPTGDAPTTPPTDSDIDTADDKVESTSDDGTEPDYGNDGGMDPWPTEVPTETESEIPPTDTATVPIQCATPCDPGFECMGRACVFILADKEQYSPASIAVDGDYVYWSNLGTWDNMHNYQNDGVINRISKTGGMITPFAEDEAFPNSIKIDETHLYWLRNDNVIEHTGSIVRKPKAGGEVAIIQEGLFNITGFELDGTHIYWSSHAGPEDPNATITRIPKDSSTDSEIIVEEPAGVLGFAIDSANADVYWLVGTSSTIQVAISKAPVDKSSAPISLGSYLAEFPQFITSDDDGVYWSENPMGMASWLKTYQFGSTTDNLAIHAGATNVGAVAPDSKDVFWAADSDEGMILRSPKTPDESETVVTCGRRIEDIAVDDEAVYWVTVDEFDTFTGSIMKVMK